MTSSRATPSSEPPAGPGALPPRPARHRLREYRRRWVHDDALGWLDITEEILMEPGQDDLTADDRLAVNTDKGDDGADLELPQPSQDPAFVPVSVVDENGNGR